MPSEKKDPEIAALESVHNALKPLDPAARRKVIMSVEALLEIPPTAAATLPSGQSSSAAEVRMPASGATARMTATRPISLIELMQEKRPSTNSEKIALFAYYREKFEGLARFARADLQPYFSKAREKPPANFDRDFVEAVKRGWIHEENAESYVTSKGIEAVESGFPSEGQSVKKARKAPAKKKGIPKLKKRAR